MSFGSTTLVRPKKEATGILGSSHFQEKAAAWRSSWFLGAEAHDHFHIAGFQWAVWALVSRMGPQSRSQRMWAILWHNSVLIVSSLHNTVIGQMFLHIQNIETLNLMWKNKCSKFVLRNDSFSVNGCFTNRWVKRNFNAQKHSHRFHYWLLEIG